MSIACELGNGRNVFLLCRLAGRIPISSLATLICVAALGCGDGGRTPSSPTAPTTSPPVAQSIAINLDVEDLTVGQTVTLTATVTLSDGSRRPVTDGAWESDNSDVAFLETTTGEEVLLRAVGAGSATLSVESGGQRGTRAVTVLPPLVIDGTLYVDADIVTSSDPTTFRNASYAGRGDRVMFDRRQNAFVTYNAFLFDATFTDGFSVEIQVNPEFQTREAAQQEADKYGGLIGQLPRALRQPEFQTVWIHRGIEPFGGGNNNVLIHTGEADRLEAQGFLEEVFIHEATHTTLDARHASSSGWIQAQGNDMNFISTYARDHPMREDLAESFPMWMALRYREDRISSRLAATIRIRMPHRLAYLDDQSFDMAPVR